MSKVEGCAVRVKIEFGDYVSKDEKEKVLQLIDHANRMVTKCFGIQPAFNILICKSFRAGQAIESEPAEAQKNATGRSLGNLHKGISPDAGVVCYNFDQIMIQCDKAKFGHYLQALIQGTISGSHTRQLQDALMWFYTLKLTEGCKYVRPSCPHGVDQEYIVPLKRLALIVGDDFLRDIATGKASLLVDAMPKDIQALFLPEELFFSRKRYYR